MNPTAQGAASLAAWVRAFYPAVYSALAQKAAVQIAAQRTIAGGNLGAFACTCSPQSMFGDIGQTTGVDFNAAAVSQPQPSTIEISTPDPATADTSASYIASLSAPAFDTVDPATLSPVSVSTSDVLPEVTAPPSTGSAATTATSPGVLSSVGNFLSSPQGITSLVNLGAAIVQNKTSQNVLAAQVARVSAGLNPAAISYSVNPATGQVTPVLQSANPAINYPLSQPLLSSLAPNASALQITSFLSQYGLWIALGFLVILIARR